MRLTPDNQLLKPAVRRPMRVFVFAIALVFAILALAPGLLAQVYPAVDLNSFPATRAAAPAPESLSSNRFLFVIDVSAPMHQHLRDIIDVVESILRSGASGQLHDGDSIGLWTFNQDVHTGVMPLQIWSSDDSEEITLRIAEFIRQQDFAKKSRLDVAVAPVAKVVKMSDIITVFIISSGAGPIHGTPYDDDINTQYQLCLRDMGKKPMPLVTVLQGKNGKFIRYTVNALPWPVVIPELPIPLKLSAEPPAAPKAAPKAAEQSVATSAAPAPTPPAAQPVPEPASTPPATTQQPQGFSSPPYAFPPTAPTPASAVPVAPPQTPPPAVAAIAPPAPPPVVIAPAPQPAPRALPTPAAPVAAPVTVAETPPSVAPVTPPAPPPVEVHPATSSVLPLVPPRPPPLVPKTLPATRVMAQETPPAGTTPTLAPASASAPAPAAPAVSAAPVQSVPAAPAQPPPKTLVTQATALIKSFTRTHRSLLLIGGVCLLAVATGLIFVMARRSRSSGRVSLISQTMNDRRP